MKNKVEKQEKIKYFNELPEANWDDLSFSEDMIRQLDLADFDAKNLFNALVEDTFNKHEQIKVSNLFTENALEIGASSSKIKNIHSCDTYIEGVATSDFKHRKVEKANFCHNKHCPICARIKAYKNFVMISTLIKHILFEEGNGSVGFETVKAKKGGTYVKKVINGEYNLVFVTFTAPNVRAVNLKDELKRQHKAFNRMVDGSKNKLIKDRTFGYVRKSEVTYNEKEDTYHPHIHAIFVIKNSDYKSGSKKKIRNKDWLKMWQKVMKDDSISQVKYRLATDIDSASKEMAKYTSKSFAGVDFQKLDESKKNEVFVTIHNAYFGSRDYGFGGMFLDAQRKYKKGELDHLLPEEPEVDYKIRYTQAYRSLESSYYIYKASKIADENKPKFEPFIIKSKSDLKALSPWFDKASKASKEVKIETKKTNKKRISNPFDWNIFNNIEPELFDDMKKMWKFAKTKKQKQALIDWIKDLKSEKPDIKLKKSEYEIFSFDISSLNLSLELKEELIDLRRTWLLMKDKTTCIEWWADLHKRILDFKNKKNKIE